MPSLTRAFEDNAPAISEQAFYQLGELYPQDVANVIYELASAGDLASCEAAVRSGIAGDIGGATLAFAMLPLTDKHPAAESVVSTWVKQSGGGDNSSQALLETREPDHAARLIRFGATLDVENSNHQNALLFAIAQNDAKMVSAILHACNDAGLAPRGQQEHNIFDMMLRRSMSDAILSLIFDSLPLIEDMKPPMRLCAGDALTRLLRENMGWKPEERPPVTEKHREVARRLMEFGQLAKSTLWDQVFEYYGVFSNEDFLASTAQQIAIVNNVIANGLDVNHVFDDVITTGFDAAGVRKLVKGTLLHFAAHQNNPELVTSVLEAGADVAVKSSGRALSHFLAKSDRAREALEAWEAKRERGLTEKRSAIAAVLYENGEVPSVAHAPKASLVIEVATPEPEVHESPSSAKAADATRATTEEIAKDLAHPAVDQAPNDDQPAAEPAAATVSADLIAEKHTAEAGETSVDATPQPDLAAPVSPVETPSEPAETPPVIVETPDSPPAASAAAATGEKKGFGFKRK